VPATAHRRPLELVYYEGCKSEVEARLREKGLKTGFGRRYLKARLGGVMSHRARNASRSQARRSCAPALLAGMRAGVRILYPGQ
jgi:hypothetical protein